MDPAVSKLKFEREVDSLCGAASDFVRTKGWHLKETTFPVLGVVLVHPRSHRAVLFRFSCDAWDELPPSLSLHDPAAGTELPWELWPKGTWSVLPAHPRTGKPFVCLPGIREYHTHDSHLSDSWLGLHQRGSYRICDIVQRVQQRFEVSDG